MKIWVMARQAIFKKYTCIRFREEAKRMGIDFKLVRPEDFDILEPIVPGKILYKGKLINVPDCIIARCGSWTTYFELAVVRHFEQHGVFVINSSASIARAKDKLRTIQLLSKANIPIPKTMLAKFPLNLDCITSEFGFPLILKMTSGSMGKGVALCQDQNQLEDIMGIAEGNIKTNVILQEFISESYGRDIRVFVIGGRALGAMLRTAQNGKFKANVSTGGKVSALDLDPALEWLAVESANLLGLEVAGVDILFDKDGYKICEVNACPMFQGFEEASGINIPEEMYQFIQVRLEGGIKQLKKGEERS